MALVLARQERQSVIITTETGRRIVVAVSEIRGSKVRLSFDADRDIRIDRREVSERRGTDPPKAA